MREDQGKKGFVILTLGLWCHCAGSRGEQTAFPGEMFHSTHNAYFFHPLIVSLDYAFQFCFVFNTMQFFVTHFILRTYRLPYLPMLSLSVSCFPCICFLEQKETLCVGRLTACVSAHCSELHVIAALKPFNGDCQHKVRPCLPAETRQGLLQRRKEATIWHVSKSTWKWDVMCCLSQFRYIPGGR